METHLRSILKAVSWRLGGTAVTTLTAWWLVGEVDLAVKIGLIDTLFKIVVFYFHERLWHRINFGKAKSPEYQI